MVKEPGMMEEKEYRVAPGLSGSQLGLLHSCPEKFKYAQEHPREATAAMKFGSLSHMAVLEPHLLAGTYSVQLAGVDYRRSSKIGKANIEALEGSGKEVIKHEDYTKAVEMAAKVHAHPVASRVLGSGQNERALFGEEDGVVIKGKLDNYNAETNVLTDYKTGADVSPAGFKWKVKDFGYLLQLSHYQALAKQAEGKEAYPGVLIVAQESEAPYAVVVYEIPQAAIDEAHATRRELLSIYAECVRSGVWPGYDKGEGIVRLDV